MGHTYTKLISHIIFSTKGRAPILSLDRRADIHDYLRGILRGIDCEVLEIGGVSDHLHIATLIPPSIAVSYAVQIAKSNSSKWINDNRFLRCRFEWQRGFGAFSVSESKRAQLLDYIRNQEEHHQQVSFQEEILVFLRHHDIAYDEKFLWS